MSRAVLSGGVLLGWLASRQVSGVSFGHIEEVGE